MCLRRVGVGAERWRQVLESVAHCCVEISSSSQAKTDLTESSLLCQGYPKSEGAEKGSLSRLVEAVDDFDRHLPNREGSSNIIGQKPEPLGWA